jgi:hypothetical protein
MKSRYILIIFIIALVILSCEKLGFEIFYASADRSDGVLWEASDAFYSVKSNEKVGLSLRRYNEYDELREALSFKNVPMSEGTYKVNYERVGNQLSDSLVATLFTRAEDGDVATEFYDIYNTVEFESWITIEKVTKNRIRGKFELAFVISPDGPPKCHAELPDTLYLTNGEFTAKNLD